MSTTRPTVVLVHGAFAESASWQNVFPRLYAEGVKAIAVANPLRSLAGDARYVRDVVRSIEGPILLVGHSYGGMVITEAAAELPSVIGLVYVGAFAPDTGESALELSGRWPGSTLGEALAAYEVEDGGTELVIELDKFPQQFAADVDAKVAAVQARTQRPVTQAALAAGLVADPAPWKRLPSWFVFGAEDRNIPAEAVRAFAERARSRGTKEVAGASHALAFSSPDEVAAIILEAAKALES